MYYLNSSWSDSLGGVFRIHHAPPHHEEYTDIEPKADRLLVFWCVFALLAVGACVEIVAFRVGFDLHSLMLAVTRAPSRHT